MSMLATIGVIVFWYGGASDRRSNAWFCPDAAECSNARPLVKHESLRGASPTRRLPSMYTLQAG